MPNYSTAIPVGTLRVIAICAIIATGSIARAQPASRFSSYSRTVAGITDASRDDTTYNDFLRIVWVPNGTSVTYIGRQGVNLRAFFTATGFVTPRITLDEYLALVGNYYHDGQDAVLMRCKPQADQRQNLAPIIATWPNVFAAIVADLGGRSYTCPAPDPTNGDNLIYCVAIAYADSAQSVFVTGLESALSLATQLYATSPSSTALSTDYGIYPAFTGLGFTVNSSGTTSSMTTVDVLRNSIVPEYLLNNLALADAGCRCVQVPEYPNPANRHAAPIDPDFIWLRGRLKDNACHQIPRLGRSFPG
ncbi:MAG TPA: hypothetical protein VEF07_04975 [Candidatus Binataceae bacterium]|nr:hypothetical protein [Candidatus Binataceae bacterium]